jgi:myb proto-oncogene protein
MFQQQQQQQQQEQQYMYQVQQQRQQHAAATQLKQLQEQVLKQEKDQQQDEEEEDDDPRMRLAPGATKIAGKRWTSKQDAQLKAAVKKYNCSSWKLIAEAVDGRTHVQCLQRWKKVLQPGLIKGVWSADEDKLLLTLIEKNGGARCWTKIADHIPGRTAKQCRERWHLNLDPSINRTPWTAEEDRMLTTMHANIGNKWAEIRRALPGRTENGVKSRFKSLLRAERKRNKQTQARAAASF